MMSMILVVLVFPVHVFVWADVYPKTQAVLTVEKEVGLSYPALSWLPAFSGEAQAQAWWSDPEAQETVVHQAQES